MDWPWHDYSAADAKTLFSGEISPAILDHAQNSHPVTLDGVMRLSSERRTPRPAPPNEAAAAVQFLRGLKTRLIYSNSRSSRARLRFGVDVPNEVGMIHDVRRD